MKWFVLAAIMCTQISCTTDTLLVTRRDLYSPDPAPDSFERQKQLAGKTRVTTTTTVTTPEEAPHPEFR